MPSPLRPPPLLNRGAAAWNREDLQPIVLTARHPDVLPIVSRAMVHAVTDDTNIDYLRVVSAALQCIDDGVRDRRWRRPQTLAALDEILCTIVDILIYSQRRGPAYGLKLHAAWTHMYPNQISALHGFSRACVGWQRMQPGIEGCGMCEERWAAIGRGLLEGASKVFRESAVWWFTQADCFAREQDMENLKNTPSDWCVLERPNGDPQVCLFFGVASRGESVKTSTSLPNQGVIIDRPWVARLFLELVRSRPLGAPIFSVSRSQVARCVKKVCDKLGIPVPVLHILRHTGPANAILKDTKSLEKVRRRGRWASLKSVERYSKTAHVVADLAKLSVELRNYGEQLLADPSAFTQKADATVLFQLAAS